MFLTYDDFIRWWISLPGYNAIALDRWHEVPRWMILALTILLVYLLLPRGLKMGTKRGKAFGWKEHFSDILTDAIEQGVHTGKITRKNAKRAYLECAQKFGLDDLRRKANSFKAGSAKIAWLKKQIKRRTKGGLDAVVPLPIPDLGPVVYTAPPVRVKKKLKI